MTEKELQKIANTLVLYSYHIEENGLLKGKSGIALYLYRYAQIYNCEYYENFAGELLDKIFKSVIFVTQDFENGLAGIGWMVNYLLKKNYVEGEPNDVLQDVDKRIFKNLKHGSNTSIFGQGIYLIERLKDNQTNPDLEKHIVNCIDFCKKEIKKNNDSGSLYYINSILFFLLKIENYKNKEKKINSIRHSLPNMIKKALDSKMFDDADLYIFNRMLDEFELGSLSKWKSIYLFKQQLKSQKKSEYQILN